MASQACQQFLGHPRLVANLHRERQISRPSAEKWIEPFAVFRLEDLTGGDVAENRDIALRILDGELGPKRDIVLVNASAGLVAYGFANDFKDGMASAARSIDSGGARGRLDALVRFTNKAQ